MFYIASKSRAQRAAALITPEFCGKAFAERYGKTLSQCAVKSVDIPHIARCGDGKASTTDRVTLTVTWEHDDERKQAACPEQMILKLSLLPWTLRLGASEALIWFSGMLAEHVLRHVGLDFIVFYGLNFYQYYFPHAPDSMYENETRFYREVRPALEAKHPDFEAPSVYGTIYDQSNHTFGVLMTDLAGPTKSAYFPNAAKDSLSVDHMRKILKTLAVLHAEFWDSPRITEKDGDLSWLPTPQKGGMEVVFHSIGRGLIRDHVRSHEFERKALAPLGLSVDELWEGLLRAEGVLSTPPLTLCHGDTHIQNTYVLPDGKVGLYDFQLSLKACWSRDVSYILGTAMLPEERKQHERALLSFYLDCLREQGVVSVPSLEEAWRLYAQGMAWGLVIGWLICPPVNYGEEIWLGNVNRLVAGCHHLDTFGQLGIKRKAA